MLFRQGDARIAHVRIRIRMQSDDGDTDTNDINIKHQFINVYKIVMKEN